jgi:hypothetical protein
MLRQVRPGDAGVNITHKRGDTFEAVVEATLNGAPLDLTGWTVRSQLRDLSNNVIKEFDVLPLDLAAGQFSLNATAQETENWSPASYLCDVELVDLNSFVQSSDTFSVRVVRDITRDDPV